MKILVTGIKGFLGRNLIDSLGIHEIFGLGTKDEIFRNIPVFNSADLDKLNLHFDFIIICHAAVASGDTILMNDDLFDVNVSLTEKIVTKFRNSTIIYISTVSIYDKNLTVIDENSAINPQSSYALSKLWGERVVSDNKRSIILRISSMYGIGMKENTLIPNYINQSIQNKKIEIWGKGQRIQNYIHVSDVANYINLIIDNQKKLFGKLILGVSKKHYSNLQIAQIISNFTKAEINFTNNDNSNSMQYNNSLTTNLLGCKAEKNIELELQKYIKWKEGKS